MVDRIRTVGVAAVVVLTAVALAGCSPSASDGDGAPGAGTGSAPSGAASTGSITVFAAASLTASFTELAAEFEKANPAASVALNFAGSSDLVTQITEGAPADVFASADEKNMTKLTDAAIVEPGSPMDFASNTLQIVVPPSNPAGIASLADLAEPGVKTVICAPQVPCGAAAVAVERAAGVSLAPVSEESSVTDVLGKVTSGEADAGLVYVTDVIAAGDAVQGVAFPEAAEAVNTYPIAPITSSKTPDLAQAFVDYVTGDIGRRVLDSAGFGQPESNR
ncbi:MULTISPECIES: molybdate ABC transporter substrate-binding protein [unclassified Leifsonia]|uniref:molybdate ABC transporter substrate-binding protein n=1 Tax=unclassified Leifsonia TaxID=2663824 RepID=UPI0006F5D59E|nr:MULTISPECIES: molybdate ABC transporter substrate-binding protein [unclassified Leifsonia]KQX07994.1 molybdate-binding protein [Leifsonia sp. Root1293]KRA12276.1 molybdate-binding protein [Leifsonia sp. Root60]